MWPNPRVPYQMSSDRPRLSPLNGKPLMVNPVVAIEYWPFDRPMPRGILATCTAKLAPGVADSADLAAALRAFYSASPFVHVLPDGQWPVTGAVAGSNGAHLQAAADIHAGRAVVVSATDNLGKGAAGQAVQIANIMLGLPETAGLTVHGVSP